MKVLVPKRCCFGQITFLIKPNTKTFTSFKSVETTSTTHSAKIVPISQIVQWNKSIANFMKNGNYQSALCLFNSMNQRTVVSWNTMMSGYLYNGKFDKARKMFDEMPERDLVSWNIMVSGCVKSKNLGAARVLFDQMPVRDVVSWNVMLSAYAQNGMVDEARRVFEMMPVKNEISWNGMLAAYVGNGMIEEARRLFDCRSSWEVVSWNCLMGGFLKNKRLDEARWVFDRIPVKDLVSWNTIISCYAQTGMLDEAMKLFEESPVKDVFTWTAIVSGHVQNDMLDDARRIFDEMPEKNVVSFNSMITGYAKSNRMDLARELFEAMPSRNTSSWNTMITGYAQNGDIEHARNLFDKMPYRDCISWAAIIAGYAQSGNSDEALQIFIEMQRGGERLNRSASTTVLSTCANIASLELGKQIHGCLYKSGFVSGGIVGNAVLAMYCKCGCIDEAHCVFEEIRERDVVTWNTLIHGYARYGFSRKALELFETMKKDRFKPDDITMVGVLSACSHTGLVDRGTEYFYSMGREYGIIANSKHYSCMIDLLGRAGRLDDAENLLKDMPFEADAATWGALLGASRIHGNTKLGEKAAQMVLAKEPWNAGMYILLSNLYAASGRWGEVRMMRLKMRDTGIKKVPGYSWIEVQNRTHVFTVGDSAHPQSGRIYVFLEDLYLRMQREGYVTSTKLVLHDVDEEEKVQMLKHHSEKLAVAFGILNIPDGRPIRVIKNLRVCEDCHTVMKFISRIEGRVIILRDNNRFHHFNNGVCTCGDYW
ncbi:hypothetical protein LIER_18041 [Lithospermum erythrorhizon]|uniref:DYW domain-containing protein n=1 Tax=Lithospermum erythrorhizon TaxID=34254 RepID=A0AAV3QGZ5_LITER